MMFNIPNRLVIDPQGVDLPERGVTVGFGTDRICLGLVHVTSGGSAMFEKIIFKVRDPAGVLGGRHRLSIRADGRRKVR